jgi:hypothetical protein
MTINKEYIKQAINEYEELENAVASLKGMRFEDLYNEMKQKYETANYDGQIFDVCIKRLLCTVNKRKWNTAELDGEWLMFDVSRNLCGDWIDTSIDELRRAVD